MYTIICRLNDSENEVILVLTKCLALHATNPSCGDIGTVLFDIELYFFFLNLDLFVLSYVVLTWPWVCK